MAFKMKGYSGFRQIGDPGTSNAIQTGMMAGSASTMMRSNDYYDALRETQSHRFAGLSNERIQEILDSQSSDKFGTGEALDQTSTKKPEMLMAEKKGETRAEGASDWKWHHELGLSEEEVRHLSPQQIKELQSKYSE